MDQEESQQSVPPAEPAIEPAPPVETKPPAASKPALKRVRPPFATAGIFAAIMTVIYLLLPAIFKAHYEFLFWGEGFMERAYGRSLLTGSLQKLVETPKPLWSLFWLLGNTPNKLLLLVALMVGGIFFLLPLVSWKLSRSALPGIVASLLLVFGFKDVLSLMVQGNWIIPYILLGLVFVLALYSRRFVWATLAVGLIGLFRPDGWFLAVFLVFYIAHEAAGQKRQATSDGGAGDRGAPQSGRHGGLPLRWYHFLPLLAPFLWMLYDHRISGDWIYTYKATVAYAVLTDVPGTSFASFWRVLLPDIISSTGVLVLLYALVGIVLRARNISREAKGSKTLAIILDPLLATALVPLIGYWLLSLQGNVIIMGRFVFLSVGLLTLFALLLPYELLRGRAAVGKEGVAGPVTAVSSTGVTYRPVYNWALIIGAIWAPLLLAGLVRLPGIGQDVHKELKVSESKMAAIEGLCDEVKKPVADPDSFKYILVPLRRYAQFNYFLGDTLAQKLISYREVSVAVMSTQTSLIADSMPKLPKGSPEFLKQLLQGQKRFSDFLPAMALWIPDDEQHYINAFAFDSTEFFRRNYLDEYGYGFRIIGEALDSTGLIYDCRHVEPGQIRILPPELDTLAPESPDSVENVR